jgi:anaerobic magnesium-protoporphyrin IX monomethyl ester cyclase
MRKGKVLFIIHDLYQEDNHFPMGPAYLAAVLTKEGYSAEAYCQDVFHYTNEQVAEHLDRNNYDIVGMGFMSARFTETVVELSKVINKHKKGAWFIFGGFGPSPIPEYVLQTTKADIVTIGESEETIIELVRAKTAGEPKLSEIKGIAYRDGDKTFVNPRRRPVNNLDRVPLPLWEIFPMEMYTKCLKLFNQEDDEKSISLLTSRGCVGKCNFCYRMEPAIRKRSINRVVEEIEVLKNTYGVTYFFMQDELFAFSKKRMIDLRDALKKANIKIKFSCDCRVDIFDEEMAQAMVDAGCQFFNFGFESADQRVLDNIHKNVTVEQNIRAAEIVRNYPNIGMGLNFLWGNIGDTPETLWKNVEFIKKYNTYKHLRTIRPVTPYPGSELYDIAMERGHLKGPADFFIKFRNSDLMTVNYTELAEREFYKHLLAANTELIMDHYRHTMGDLREAEHLISTFKDLYEGRIMTFRGARHYEKKGIR